MEGLQVERPLGAISSSPPRPEKTGFNMTRLTCACAASIALSALALKPLAQTVYPTGTTIYDPDRSWNGFTVLSPLAGPAVLLIDMNGNVVKRWEGFNNSAGGPARVFPGGVVMAANGARPPHQESLELVRQDFAGTVVWRFSGTSRSRRARARRSGRRASTTTGSWRASPPATTHRRVRLRSTASTRSC